MMYVKSHYNIENFNDKKHNTATILLLYETIMQNKYYAGSIHI